jgi:hypothetical protein
VKSGGSGKCGGVETDTGDESKPGNRGAGLESGEDGAPESAQGGDSHREAGGDALGPCKVTYRGGKVMAGNKL